MLLTLNSVIVIGSNQPGIHALWNNKINIEIGGKSIEKAAPTHVLKFFLNFSGKGSQGQAFALGL